MPKGTDPWTVGVWIKPTHETGYISTIVSWGSRSPDKSHNQHLRFYVNDTTIGWNCSGISSKTKQFDAFGYDTSLWHYVVLTYTGTALQLYVDDLATPLLSQNGTLDVDPCSFRIGSNEIGLTSQRYKGLMDDFIFLPYAATTNQMQRLKDGDWRGVELSANDTVEFEGAGRVANSALLPELKGVSGVGLDGGLDLDADLTVKPSAGRHDTFSGKLKGTGGFTKAGAADSTLVLDGVNTHSGGTTVASGTLALRRSIADDGLVGAWPLAEGATECDDVSANRNDLKKLEATDSKAGVKKPYFALKSTLGQEAFPTDTNACTFSAWIRPTPGTTNLQSVARLGTSSGRGGLIIRFYSSDKQLRFDATGTGYSADDFTANAGYSLFDGVWHHLVYVYDAGAVKARVYVDGVQKAEKTLSDEFRLDLASGTVQLRYAASDYAMLDAMRDVCLYNRAWTAAEVAAEYAGTRTMTSRPPIPKAHWTFDGTDIGENTGTTAGAYDLTAASGVTAEAVSGANGKAVKVTGGADAALSVAPTGLFDAREPFTFSVRCKNTDTTVQGSGHFRRILCIGVTNDMNYVDIDVSRRYGYYRACFGGGKSDGGAYNCEVDFFGKSKVPTGMDRLDWVTLTAVYLPTEGDDLFVRRVYLNGELVNEAKKISAETRTALTDICNVANAKLSVGMDGFTGYVDDVQVFDRALTPGEVRLIARSLDAGTSQLTASVLPATGAVTVGAGATLRVDADQTLSSLSGTGTLDIGRGRTVTLTEGSFGGTVTGLGSLAVSGRSFSAATPADLPLVSSAGKVTLPTTATVNLGFSTPGTYTLVSAGEPLSVNPANWTVVTPEGRNRVFLSDDGKSLLVKVNLSGVILIFR